MSKRTLIWITVTWVLLTLYSYFYMNFFLVGITWLVLTVTMIVFVFIQVVRLIKERNSITSLRIQSVVVFTTLFLLTYNRSFTNSIIEKVDWRLSYNRRLEIVEQVKAGKLNPNVSWNSWVCELPFEFPVVSNGGNDIGIDRNENNGTTTVQFWVFRNFFDSPSIYFVYTDDPDQIKKIESKIQQHPKLNWKLKDNWYRTFGD